MSIAPRALSAPAARVAPSGRATLKDTAVSLSVALPEGATRAAGADSALGAIDNGVMNNYDVRFILEVYDMSGAAPELAKERMVQSGQSTTATFNFRLVPGRNYNFVVWAQTTKL